MIMADKSKVEGLGGWLILITIGLFLGAGIWLFSFILWGFLLFSGESSPYGLSIFLLSAVLAYLLIYSLVLEFKKKKEFPKWAIIALWAGVIAAIFLSILDGDYSTLFGAIVGAIIWTWYFKVSKRVKNTFIK